MFLNCCGNQLLHYIWHSMKKKVFYPDHRVVSLQLLNTGEVMISVQKRGLVVKKIDRKGNAVYGE